MIKKRHINYLTIGVLIIAIVFLCNYFNEDNYNDFLLDSAWINQNGTSYEEKITSLKKVYNNEDIKAILYIENTNFITPVVQGKDNNYYLNHSPDKQYNVNGSIFLDYRLNVETAEKILIFGHSSDAYDLPIEIIENYEDFDFWEKHKYIGLDTNRQSSTFIVLGAYVETENFDYMKLNFASESEKLQHYQTLLKNSFYDTGETITTDDSLLIIQTCSTLSTYKDYLQKYFLLLAKKIFN